MKQIIHTSMSTLDSKITAHSKRQQENKIAKLKIVTGENLELFVTMWYKLKENLHIA